MKYRELRNDIFRFSALACLLVLSWTLCAAAQDQPAVVKVTTVAGGYINDKKPAATSALQYPRRHA